MLKINLIPILVSLFIVVVEMAISFNSVLLPNIKDYFIINENLSQMTIALGLFTLGLSGVIYGALSDSIGRRPVLLFSTLLFCFSSYFCFISTNINQFLGAKFFQGFGSGAGWVVGNACIKDLYEGREYTNMMNRLHACVGIVPAIAPVLGSYIAVSLGWRECFLILFFLSLLILVVMIFYQKETLKVKQIVSFSRIVKDYQILFSCKQFRQYLFIKVMAVMLIFCEISNIPLIFVKHLGVREAMYGWYVLPAFLVYIAFNILSSYMNNFLSIKRIVHIGLVLIIISNIILVILNYFIILNPINIQAIKLLTYAGWGLIFGNATAEIVSAMPRLSSMASSIMIASEMLASAFGIYLLGCFFSGTVLPLSIMMVLVGIITMIFSVKYGH